MLIKQIKIKISIIKLNLANTTIIKYRIYNLKNIEKTNLICYFIIYKLFINL